MAKYYAVRTGKKTGIFNSWEECKEAVTGFIGAKYKSFSDLDSANAFLSGESENLEYSYPTAYIDGSFNQVTNEYSFGGVLIIENKTYEFKKKYASDDFSVHRNVAGEIKGAGFIIQYCINHGIKNLAIYYDYEGIEKWYQGYWQAKTPIALKYVEFANSVREKITIDFHKVKSHTNNKYNDLADQLAKQALGII